MDGTCPDCGSCVIQITGCCRLQDSSRIRQQVILPDNHWKIETIVSLPQWHLPFSRRRLVILSTLAENIICMSCIARGGFDLASISHSPKWPAARDSKRELDRAAGSSASTSFIDHEPRQLEFQSRATKIWILLDL